MFFIVHIVSLTQNPTTWGCAGGILVSQCTCTRKRGGVSRDAFVELAVQRGGGAGDPLSLAVNWLVFI